MLLFGIPHKGLVVDDIQKMLAGQDKHPRGALLEQIRSKSSLLADQLVDFKNLIRDRKVVSFYETGQTRQLEWDSESKCWKRTGSFVTAVDTDSALLQLPDSIEDKIPLDADHSMIVKFDAKWDRGYTSARDKLLQFERDAPDVVEARFLPSPGPDSKKEDKECIQHLRVTDPGDDKKRIEDTKGGLLKGAYCWILENSDFQQWRDDQRSRLLWIKGDPGKGKTMLLCGIVNELTKSMAKTDILSYFFCQATDSRINNATAVLRGLLYLLINQQPSLVSHIRKKHDHAGKALFEDTNAWAALSEIFTSILQDPNLNNTYLLVDALDECVVDLPKLLYLIVQISPVSSRVKWIVSSRNWPGIEERLERAGHKVRLCLELNAESVSTAVGIFIQHKVSQLAELKGYDNKTREAVLSHLSLHANDTFLWVALVCQNLEKIPRWKALAKLSAFPPGLDRLYERMIEQTCNSEDVDLCKQILALISTVYRPVTLKELTSLVEMLDNMANDLLSIREIISLCGSFLTVQEDTIYFVHQSAKDFLFAKAFNIVFPSGREEVHHTIFLRSLQVMSKTLQRDMYNLGSLGYPAKQVTQPDPDPLAASRYSCIYWVDHLHDWNPNSSANHRINLQDEGIVDRFIRDKYLYWLEALSLCKSIPEGVVSIAKLGALVQERANACALTKLVQDAHRFIMYHKWAIENSPLQAYASALVFSPASSLIRGLFKKEEPRWITIKPAIEDEWGACLQTLEGHSLRVESAAFSYDLTRLTLKGHSNSILSVAFSHDSTRLASASYDNTVKIWDVNSGAGACLQTLQGHSGWIRSVAFSHDSTRLASALGDGIVKIWDANSGACLQTLQGHSGWIRSVAFSHDSTQLASASRDRTVKIWDANSSVCLQTLEGHSDWVESVAFSHDSTRLASASDDNTVKIWDANSGVCLQTLKGHSDSIRLSVAFSHNSTRLASASYDKTVKIWDVNSGACLQTLEGHSDWVWSVAFSHDSTRLASASYDGAVKIWDANSGVCLQTLKGHSDWVLSVAFSHNSARLASASRDSTVKIWDANSGACLQTLKGYRGWVGPVAFSHDSTRLASALNDHTVKIWDANSGACLQTLEGHSWSVESVAFSYNSTRLASASRDRTVKIWDANSGACLQTLKGHSNWVRSVAFSHDSTRLASASDDNTVKIWDVNSGACLQTLNVDKALRNIFFDTTGLYLHTEIGTISVSAIPLVSSSTPAVIEAQKPRYQGLALSSDGDWITHNSKKLLWLPSEYRPLCSATSDRTIGVGAGTGRVWIYESLLNIL
ncbi:WD40 repeat-like protein [Mytilinidion resinicola]|uniref:Mitochondrial division protein 1 n=1 Tax=Mytilinidion resinicola TaxID=574789 RepID=A0A6A6Y3E6_9PEZI|nr:WD40 repeat-like protein [Mytilinidion resinicola]KAF2802307.1 WD40 repeat-like protein [Mytilinidion resinicola]